MSQVETPEAAHTGGMHEVCGVVGYFPDADALRAGMEHVVASGIPEREAFLPTPDLPTIGVFEKDSPVRWVALAGGLTGITAALAMTIWMSWDYPLIVGGKPITALPPFLVVTFELMILFGSIASAVGFLWFARLPDLTLSPVYRPPMAVSEFAIHIPTEGKAECAYAEKVLREAGAIEIDYVHDTPLARLQVLS